VNLYYTGLKDEAKIAEQDGIQKTIKIDRNNIAWFDVEIPAHSQTWFVIKSN
jgi:hypothetical protein